MMKGDTITLYDEARRLRMTFVPREDGGLTIRTDVLWPAECRITYESIVDPSKAAYFVDWLSKEVKPEGGDIPHNDGETL